MDGLVQLYSNMNHSDSDNKVLWSQVYLRHWLTSVLEFDPRTFEPTTATLSEFCQNSRKVLDDIRLENHDFLYHIAVNILSGSLNLLLSNLNTKIVREHEVMPLVNAREFDRVCMRWVARKSGRNLKEKLALDNKVLAVKRHQNYDTTENRLLKRVLGELQYLFDEKQAIFNLSDKEYEEQELVELIESWLVSEESCQIGSWQNLPPNNTLLQHKYYRKIWYVYQFLQKIDDIIESDKYNYHKNIFLVLHFQLISKLLQYREVRIAQVPIQADFEKFIINTGLHYHNYVKSYLIKNNKPIGYFELKILDKFYQVKLFNERNENLFDIQCLLNEDAESLFKLKFSIRGGKYNFHLIRNIDELIFQIMSGFNHILDKEQPKISSVKLKNPIIDFSDTQIGIHSDNAYHKFGNLIAQIWENVDENYTTDTIYVGNSNALYVNNNVKTYSLYNSLESSKEVQSKIIPVIAQNLSKYITFDKMTCIITDKFGDFDLQVLKQSLNIYFGNVYLLPKSIAGVFSLLANKKSIEDNVNYLFVDMDNNSIIFTRLSATSPDEDLLESGYGNLVWERYPTDVIEIGNPLRDYLCNTSKINEDFCDIISTNFNLKDINSLNLSLLNDLECQHFEMLNIDKNQIRIERKYFDNAVGYIHDFIQNNSNAKIIINSELIYIIPKKYKDITITIDDFNVGVEFLLQKQEKFSEHSDKLWRDHLPYMGIRIKGESGYEKFDLVKNITVSPKRGQKVSIPVNDIFILPKDQKQYNFPLYLGDKSQANMYQATLKSIIFPLKYDTECQVKLYYTYGAEDPYELYFITDKKEKIKAEWKVFDDSNVEYPIPEYPKPLTLEELKSFETKTGEIINLIDKVQAIFSQFLQYLSHKNRESGIINSIPKGKDYLFISTKNGESVQLHKNNLIDNINFNDLELGNKLYFELFKNKQGKLSAVGASFSEGYPYEFYIENFLRNNQKKFNWNRFIIYTLFNNAQEFNKSDVGNLYDDFHNVIGLIEKIKENCILKNQNIKEYFDSILYCNYIDIDEGFLKEILSDLTAKKVKVNKNLAYLLGGLNKDWQYQIYECLTNLLQSKKKSEVYQVFGIAFWRHSELIYKLSDEQVKMIWFGVADLIEELIKNSKNSKKYNFFYELSKYWQLVLALLRLRNRKACKQLFNPSSQVIEKLVYLLSETEKLVLVSKEVFRTYINFSLEKPKDEKSSDFFYALRLYLTGDDGANAIRIKVSDEEQ